MKKFTEGSSGEGSSGQTKTKIGLKFFLKISSVFDSIFWSVTFSLYSGVTKVLHVTAHFQYYMHNNFTVAHSNALNFLILVNKLFTNKMVKKIEVLIGKIMYNAPILSLSEIHCSCLDHLLSDFCPLLFTHFRCLINFLHDILNITYHKY